MLGTAVLVYMVVVCTWLLQGAREENAAVDMAKATREAQELFSAGEKKLGTDESKFNHILATRSYPQLRATFDEYIKVSAYNLYIYTEPRTAIMYIVVLVWSQAFSTTCLRYKLNHVQTPAKLH